MMGAMTTRPSTNPVFLGIEAGGTRTVALAAGPRTVRREFGPANLRLLTDAQLDRHFRKVAKDMPRPAGIAIGMAGARTKADRERIRRAADSFTVGLGAGAGHADGDAGGPGHILRDLAKVLVELSVSEQAEIGGAELAA